SALKATSTRTGRPTPPSTGRSGRVGRRIAVTDRDEVELEEANEQRAIAAYEKHMGVSADDPAYGPDLSQWMAGWNAALAQQPAAVFRNDGNTEADAVAGLVEEVARTIYDEWRDKPGFVGWVEGGNSDMQDQ